MQNKFTSRQPVMVEPATLRASLLSLSASLLLFLLGCALAQDEEDRIYPKMSYRKIVNLPVYAKILSSYDTTVPQVATRKLLCANQCMPKKDCIIYCVYGMACNMYSSTAYLQTLNVANMPSHADPFDACYIKMLQGIPMNIDGVTSTPPDDVINDKQWAVDNDCYSGSKFYHSAYVPSPWWQIEFSTPVLVKMVIVVMDYSHMHYSSVQVRLNTVSGSGVFNGTLLTLNSTVPLKAGGGVVYLSTNNDTYAKTVSIQAMSSPDLLSMCEVVVI